MLYTLTSYEPVSMKLPKPLVPLELIEQQIEKLMEPFSEYHEVAEDRPCMAGDYIVVATEDARMDGNPAKHFFDQFFVSPRCWRNAQSLR